MDVFRTDRIRNVVLLGHGGAGKTTLTEAMAYLSGITNRLGKVTDGNTISDYDKEEIKRKFSISTSTVPVVWDKVKVNILDTPGFFDFEEEAEEEEAPEAAFHVGDIIDFVNVNKEGNMEFLTGTVIDGPARDDNGWYCRAETHEGRKFKTPINLTDTRLGTRVQRIHEH